MNSVDSHIRLLSSQFIVETSIPVYLLSNPSIISAINNYRWFIAPSNIKGWITVKKNIFFSD
jgi:hypothetical protein